MKAVAGYFRVLRKHLGISKETVARKVQISVKQVYNWEDGANLPKSPQLAALLEVLGGEYDDISSYLKLAIGQDPVDETTFEEGEEIALRRIAKQELSVEA